MSFIADLASLSVVVIAISFAIWITIQAVKS